MAARFSATGQGYSRTLSLGTQTKVSVTCWVKMSVDRATPVFAWSLEGSGQDSLALATIPDINRLAAAVENGSPTALGPTMVVGTWYFFGLSYNAGAVTLTYRTLSATTFSTSTGSGGQPDHALTTFYISSPSGWINGCVAGLKAWVGTAMTAAQLQSEAWSYLPRYPMPTFWYPLLATETTDYSGNGRTLSGGSGAATEDGPAIGWGRRGSREPVKDTIEIVLGQAESTETAGVIIQRHTVGMAVETNTARSTVIETIVDTVTEINLAAEIVDPIAIGVTALTASSAAASAQSWSTASVAPTANRLVLLCVSWAASTAAVAGTIASVTGNGLTWVLLRGQNYGAATGTTNARHRMEVWRALGPAPTAGAITITHAASQPAINRCWSVFEVNSTDLSGTSGSGAVRQSAVNLSTAATTATATLGAFGNTANATFGFGAGASAMSIGAGFTAIATQLVSTPTPAVSLITEWFLGVDTTVNASQSTSGQFGIIGFEIKRRFVEPLTGPPLETDLAQAITRRKTKTLGIAAETDASRALVVVRTKALGQASLANAAQVIVRRALSIAVSQATETETSRALTALKTKAMGQVSLTNAAQVLSRLKTRALGLVTGTHTAQALSRFKTAAVARSVESTTAQALTRLKLRAVGMATSTGLAQALTRLKTRAIGLAAGTNTAQAFTRLKMLALSRSTEVDSARTLTAVYVKTVGMAADTGVARALVVAKAKLLGMATGPEAAQALSVLKTRAVATATSTELARIIGRARTIAQVVSTEAARGLTTLRTLGFAQVLETALARGIGRVVTIGQAVGTETARLLGLERGLIQVVEPNHARDIVSQPTLSAPVGQASATDAAQAVTFVFTRIVALYQVTITNTALSLTPMKLVPITLAVESNTAQTIHRLLVEQVTETDTARTVNWRRPGEQIDLEGSSGPITGTGSSAVVYLVGEGQGVSLQSVLDPIDLDLDGSY